MKTTIAKEALMEAVRSCLRVTPANHQLPVVSCLRVIRDAIGLHFQGTDLVTFITHSIPDPAAIGDLAAKLAAMRAEREACDFLAPVTTLRRAAQNADPGSTIKLSAQAAHFTMNGLTCAVPLLSLPVKEFPTEPVLANSKGAPWTITKEAAEAIARAAPFVSADETRYVLNGVYWDESGTIVSTNGRRLFRSEGHSAAPNVIIPTKALPLIEAGMAAVTNGALIQFHGLTVRISTQLVDGTFPNYARVIPEKNGLCALRVNAEAIGNTLTRLRPTDPRRNYVALRCRDSSIQFTMGDDQQFIAPAKVVANGPPPKTRIVFDPNFLAEALLAGFDTLYLSDDSSPSVLTSNNPRETHVLMVMPVNAESPKTTSEPEKERV